MAIETKTKFIHEVGCEVVVLTDRGKVIYVRQRREEDRKHHGTAIGVCIRVLHIDVAQANAVLVRDRVVAARGQ